MEPPFE